MPFGGFLTLGFIGAAGAVGSAAIGAHAAGKAADQRAEAAKEATALQREMYLQARADQGPWRSAGSSAVGTLAGLMGLPPGPSTNLNAPYYHSLASGAIKLAGKLPQWQAAGIVPTGRPEPNPS